MSERKTGTVKFYNPAKGFGFILQDKGEDLFVHKSAINPRCELVEGKKVSYIITQGQKGPQAAEVNNA